jgi:predicted nucleotide-binding protein
MTLPIRTVLEDLTAVGNFLSKKPTGTTVTEAKKILDAKYLDGRKLSALKFWGIIEESPEGRLKLTEEGRTAMRDSGAALKSVLTRAIARIDSYRALVERAAHRKELSLAATDAAVHWHEHFSEEASENDKILNDQAVCFFQLAEGAGLGQVVVGRRGSPTRFEFNEQALNDFADGNLTPAGDDPPSDNAGATPVPPVRKDLPPKPPAVDNPPSGQTSLGQAIFVAHGKNKKPLEQLKQILDQFKIPYRVATEEPNLGRPIGNKVKETMQLCNCAILIFTADEEFKDASGNTVWRPSENVAHELGASGFLYGNRIVIMKETDVQFPSNFRELGHISFEKDRLDSKAMDILKELIGFGIVKVST